ncbi:LmbE family protein [Thermoanaerobacterium xylanolyticum LX-11]|uniref:LmbE family protein n=1 Tax=Thermoanaerobacterium xylanolyticum (strain ATCC 49914 / DSM 7097 / LX-11) TaxID=858215 RepID=F6BJ79_THEXL|nr:PIG-L family deacetylase [Thermoanaerobacterium xylanolyticum]AEF17896.1 LmbE family protein [Thermoanaerobacterium xylanolyticum LX-11]
MILMVVSPHPDDETLGAGGTILRYKKNGYKIAWLNFTDKKEEYGYSITEVNKRTSQINNVIKSYDFDYFYNLKLQPSGLDKYHKKDLIEEVSNIIRQIEPNRIILPYKYDVHSDHKVVFDVLNSCTKVFRFPFIKCVLMMEIPSESDYANPDNGFVPNYFINITDFIENKIKILNIYDDEIKEHPFPRSEDSVKSLALIRGCASGFRYAEGFRILKFIED